MRTGVGFLADIKEDRADFCGDDFIWNLKFPAHSCHRFQIHIAKPQIHRNGAQFIFFRVKPPQMMKGMEQCQAVLSAGHSYGDTVTVLNQPVCIKSLACQASEDAVISCGVPTNPFWSFLFWVFSFSAVSAPSVFYLYRNAARLFLFYLSTHLVVKKS